MARLESFQLKIQTGERGPASQPRYSINGFEVDFDHADGGLEPGGLLQVSGNPRSFPHSLVLTDPGDGTWNIKSIEATYSPEGEEPYTIRFGAVTLDEETSLNIWHERPPKVIDV